MSEDRSSLTVAPPEPTLVSGLPPLETANPLAPPAMTPTIAPSLVNPLAPTRAMPVNPLGPTRVVQMQTVQARDVPMGQQWGLTTPTMRGQVDWNDEQMQLRQRVSRMWNDMPDWVRNNVGVESGFRTHEQQADLWQKHLRGEIGRTAQPGSSLHEQGLAADWHFDSPEAKAWMQGNAGKYGLAFPFEDDDGHMQTIERTGSLSPEAKTGAILPKVPAQYRQPLLDAAYANGIEPRLLASVIQQESSFDPKSGPQIGLGQLTPDTANDMGVNPYDINDNLMGAARRLRKMYDDPRVQGDPRKAVMLYNSGPGGTFANTQYADAVMKNYDEFGPDQYVQAPGGFKSGMVRPASYTGGGGYTTPPDLSVPTGQGAEGTAPTLPPPPPLGMLGSPGLLALAMGLASRRIGAANVSYDPWTAKRIGQADPNIGQSLASLGSYTTRIGRTVPGPAGPG